MSKNPTFTKSEKEEALDICAMAMIRELYKLKKISYATYNGVVNDLKNKHENLDI